MLARGLGQDYPRPNPAATLGSDGSLLPASWGHMAPMCIANLAPTAFRFYGRSGCHPRVIHFASNASSLITYFSTGVGSANPVEGQHQLTKYSLYTDHTAVNIPQKVNAGQADMGDLAMTFHTLVALASGTWTCGQEWNGNIRWCALAGGAFADGLTRRGGTC